MTVKILFTLRNLSEEEKDRIRSRVGRVSNGLKLEFYADRAEALRSIRDAEILVAGLFDREIFRSAEKLRWVHAWSAGVERYLFPEFVESPVILTNSSGVHRKPISEMALAMMLFFAKKLNVFFRQQMKREWRRVRPDELAGKTVGIIGLGNIGTETAWKAKCFGMRVLAVKRRLTAKPVYVDEVFGVEDLDLVIRESDFIVLTVPLTGETRHMIGERELRLMKPTAVLINLCRGSVVDEKALVRALKEGWIAGAGLDVFEEEPLPSSSELWHMDNVLITPHVSGATPYYHERALDIFCDNLNRYLNGRPLRNIVDKKRGY